MKTTVFQFEHQVNGTPILPNKTIDKVSELLELRSQNAIELPVEQDGKIGLIITPTSPSIRLANLKEFLHLIWLLLILK